MVDLLVTLAQGLCIAGLLYGAYRSITYSRAQADRRRRQYRGVWARYSAYKKCATVSAGRICSDAGARRHAGH